MDSDDDAMNNRGFCRFGIPLDNPARTIPQFSIRLQINNQYWRFFGLTFRGVWHRRQKRAKSKSTGRQRQQDGAAVLVSGESNGGTGAHRARIPGERVKGGGGGGLRGR